MAQHFRQEYLAYKKQGLTDETICIEKMFISKTVLQRLKREYGLSGYQKATRCNYQGVTEEQFKQADGIGVGRYYVLKRVRNGWGIERAITVPLSRQAKGELI